jgi:phosphate uptake regulator
MEEECLKMLALHQPVASALRLVVAAMKINTENVIVVEGCREGKLSSADCLA